MDPTTNDAPAPKRNPDARKWSKAEIVAALNSLPIPSCMLHVHRANRHDPTSDVQALTLVCDGMLTYDAITQIAGLFDTPHITFEPKGALLDERYNDLEGVCAPAAIEIIVRWEAPVPVSKVASPTPLPESIANKLPYACPVDGTPPACVLPPDGKTAREILDDVRASMNLDESRANELCEHDATGWQPR